MAARKFDVKTYPGFVHLTVLCLLILYVPLIIVTVYSFNASPSIVIWEGFSFRWYVDVLTGPESEKFKSAAWNSFIIAITAEEIVLAVLTGDDVIAILAEYRVGTVIALDGIIVVATKQTT